MSVRDSVEGWWDGLTDGHREYVRRGIWFAGGFLLGSVLL